MLKMFAPGQRVRLMPHLDLWARGATTGTVVSVTRNGVRVRVEIMGRAIGGKAGYLFRNPADSLEPMESTVRAAPNPDRRAALMRHASLLRP